jgi:hypothetical protein
MQRKQSRNNLIKTERIEKLPLIVIEPPYRIAARRRQIAAAFNARGIGTPRGSQW